MKIFIALLLLVALVTGCGQPAAQPPSAPNPMPRTIANFGNITTNMTLQQVMDKFGKYDRAVGSGILAYEYDLADGSTALLSPDWPFQLTNRIRGIKFYQRSNAVTHLP
jgi:hypothetical protein